MPSTLQFKFNINLDDVVESRGRFFPSEYADIISEKGEWKLMPELTLDPDRTDNWKLASVGAQDQNGNLWGLEIRVDNFTAASIDEYEVSLTSNLPTLCILSLLCLFTSNSFHSLEYTKLK